MRENHCIHCPIEQGSCHVGSTGSLLRIHPTPNLKFSRMSLFSPTIPMVAPPCKPAATSTVQTIPTGRTSRVGRAQLTSQQTQEEGGQASLRKQLEVSWRAVGSWRGTIPTMILDIDAHCMDPTSRAYLRSLIMSWMLRQ